MSLEECIKKGIAEAYPIEVHSSSYSPIHDSSSYFYYECGKSIVERIQSSEWNLLVQDTVLLKNVDFDDDFRSCVVENEAPPVEKPILTHLEEIAEMNVRLRSKLIKEMNMSDRSLLNDSPIHIGTETPTAEIPENEKTHLVVKEEEVGSKTEVRVVQEDWSDDDVKLVMKSKLGNSQSIHVNKEDWSDDDVKPVVKLKLEQSQRVFVNKEDWSDDEWEDVKSVVLTQDKPLWNDTNPVEAQPDNPPLVIPKPSSRRRSKRSESKVLLSKEKNPNPKVKRIDSDDWKDTKPVDMRSNQTQMEDELWSDAKLVKISQKVDVQPIETKSDDAIRGDSKPVQLSQEVKMATQTEVQSKVEDVNPISITQDDWSDGSWNEPTPVRPRNQEDVNPISITDDDWSDDSQHITVSNKDEWEDSKPIKTQLSIVTKTDSWSDDDPWNEPTPVRPTKQEDDWEKVKPAVQSEVQSKVEDDWSDGSWGESKQVMNEQKEDKGRAIQPSNVTKTDSWSDDSWNEPTPVRPRNQEDVNPISITDDDWSDDSTPTNQSNPKPTSITNDDWSDDSTPTNQNNPKPTSITNDDWSDDSTPTNQSNPKPIKTELQNSNPFQQVDKRKENPNTFIIETNEGSHLKTTTRRRKMHSRNKQSIRIQKEPSNSKARIEQFLKSIPDFSFLSSDVTIVSPDSVY